MEAADDTWASGLQQNDDTWGAFGDEDDDNNMTKSDAFAAQDAFSSSGGNKIDDAFGGANNDDFSSAAFDNSPKNNAFGTSSSPKDNAFGTSLGTPKINDGGDPFVVSKQNEDVGFGATSSPKAGSSPPKGDAAAGGFGRSVSKSNSSPKGAVLGTPLGTASMNNLTPSSKGGTPSKVTSPTTSRSPKA